MAPFFMIDNMRNGKAGRVQSRLAGILLASGLPQGLFSMKGIPLPSIFT